MRRSSSAKINEATVFREGSGAVSPALRRSDRCFNYFLRKTEPVFAKIRRWGKTVAHRPVERRGWAKEKKKKKTKRENSVKNVRRIFARDIPVSLVNYARVSFGDKSRRDCSNVDSFRWDWHSRVMDRGEGKSILERIFLFYVKFFSLPSFFLPFRSRIIRFVCDSWRFTICVYRSIAQRREEWKQSGKEWVN